MQGFTHTRKQTHPKLGVFTKSGWGDRPSRKKIVTRCNHRPIIRNILKEWKAQTKGTLKKSGKHSKYGCDYYLSNGNQDNRRTHVHLITKNYFDNKLTKRKTPFKPKNNKIGYCIKKNGKHSRPTLIQPTSSAKQIVSQMRKTMKTYNPKLI